MGEYTWNIICPYCGTKNNTPWEYNMDDGDKIVASCGECGKDFNVQCSVDVTYTAWPLEVEA